MQIEYDNDKVEKIFNDLSTIQKKLGFDLTKTLKKRLNQLKSSNTFQIYLSTGLGKPHSLEGDHKGMYGVSISGNVRLIIKPISEDLKPESLKTCDSIIIKGV